MFFTLIRLSLPLSFFSSIGFIGGLPLSLFLSESSFLLGFGVGGSLLSSDSIRLGFSGDSSFFVSFLLESGLLLLEFLEATFVFSFLSGSLPGFFGLSHSLFLLEFLLFSLDSLLLSFGLSGKSSLFSFPVGNLLLQFISYLSCVCVSLVLCFFILSLLLFSGGLFILLFLIRKILLSLLFG